MERTYKGSFMLALAILALILNASGVKPAFAASESANNSLSNQKTIDFHGSKLPAPPVVNKPPTVTSDTTPIIAGMAEEGTRVNVWYLDDAGTPVQICKDVLVEDDDDREEKDDFRGEDRGNWSCESSVVLPEGEIELVVNVSDKKGNTSPDTTYKFIIDSTPPTAASIVRASANPTSASSVDWTLTFSEPVTGLDLTDFTLTVTGTITGAAVDSVTGSGETYSVTANTGLGTGTIRLDIPATATITDQAGNPLGGLPYTSGEVYTIVAVQNYEAETIGVFRPGVAAWHLRNSNSAGPPDISNNYGLGSDYPVVGDWDGNGTDTIGVYRNGTFYLSNSNDLSSADIVFSFGAPGDQPVAGDWDGDGIDTVGVYRSSTITFELRNSNSTGGADLSFLYGVPGDVGIAGDWDGNGIDTIGVYRPSQGAWYLKSSNTTGVGDIAFYYGLIGDKPVKGDWNNDGIDTIGVYRNAAFYLNNSNSDGFADLVVPFGNIGDMPIAGNWDGLP